MAPSCDRSPLIIRARWQDLCSTQSCTHLHPHIQTNMHEHTGLWLRPCCHIQRNMPCFLQTCTHMHVHVCIPSNIKPSIIYVHLCRHPSLPTLISNFSPVSSCWQLVRVSASTASRQRTDSEGEVLRKL